jgi:hypothetical protein
MTSPTLGITILIILVFANLAQLLMQGREHRKRHREIQERLERIEAGLRS